jgi:hypothetical protein
VSKLGVNRACNNLGVDLPELISSVTEGYNLCGANEGAEKYKKTKMQLESNIRIKEIKLIMQQSNILSVVTALYLKDPLLVLFKAAGKKKEMPCFLQLLEKKKGIKKTSRFFCLDFTISRTKCKETVLFFCFSFLFSI